MQYYLRLVLNILIPILLILMIFMVGPKVVVFFLPFLIGFLISMIARPLIRLMNEKTHIMKRQHASVVVITLFIVLIGLGLYAIVVNAYSIAKDLMRTLPDLYQSAMQSFQVFLESHSALFDRLPKELTDSLLETADNLDSYIKDIIGQISMPVLSASLGIVSSLPNLLVYTVVTVFSAFIFCKDGERYISMLRSWVPERFEKYLVRLKEDGRKILHGWLYAQLKIMMIIFVFLSIGFLIRGIHFAIPLAFLTAFLDMLPMLGVGFIMWPWIAIELFSGAYGNAVYLTILYMGTQVVRQVMQPKIMGDSFGLSPMLTILFLFLGFKLYGIAGMIFAVPLGMIVVTFYRYGAFDKMISSGKELLQKLIEFL